LALRSHWPIASGLQDALILTERTQALILFDFPNLFHCPAPATEHQDQGHYVFLRPKTTIRTRRRQLLNDGFHHAQFERQFLNDGKTALARDCLPGFGKLEIEVGLV
jgi:hypothetical protein